MILNQVLSPVMSYARTQFQTVCVSFTKTSQVAGTPFRNSGELIRYFPSNFTLLPHALTENYIYDGPEPTVWRRGDSLAQISRVSVCAEAGRTPCSWDRTDPRYWQLCVLTSSFSFSSPINLIRFVSLLFHARIFALIKRKI